MPPITIHRDAPINSVVAAKPDGVTPQTATDNSANPPPTRTTPAYAPATTTASSSNPPAPQPGARPIPPTATAQATSPPAPQLSYTAHHVTTETRQTGPPPQFTQPPPTDSQLAGRSTVTSTTASKPGPTLLNLGPVASPFQSADTEGAAPTRASFEHPPGYTQAPDNAPFTSGGGIGEQAHQGTGGSSGGGVGATAWNVLTKAGDALKKGEEAAWKAVRNK